VSGVASCSSTGFILVSSAQQHTDETDVEPVPWLVCRGPLTLLVHDPCKWLWQIS